MMGRHGLLLLLSWVSIVAEAADTAASAPVAAPPAPREIVQQRLPDGRVIFTDRPQPGAKTERSWLHTPEDPAAAEARRAAAQRESDAVSDRIARQMERDRERERDLELARARAAQAAAERDAAQARAEAQANPPVILLPRSAWRPLRPDPRPEVRPEPRPAPKPKPPPRSAPSSPRPAIAASER